MSANKFADSIQWGRYFFLNLALINSVTALITNAIRFWNCLWHSMSDWLRLGEFTFNLSLVVVRLESHLLIPSIY